MPENKVTVVITGDNQSAAAFAQLTASLEQMSSKFKEFGKQVAEALAIEEVTRRLVEFGAQTLEAEANLAKMSQRTGVAVEQLSELAYAASISGVSTEIFEKGIKKLQQSLESAATGGQKAKDAFASLGINVRDSNGHVLNAADALEQIAQRFSETKDGTEKAAIAMQIFGARTGTQLIPLLDQGSDGIAKLRDEAHLLGKALTDDAAEAAELFSQNIIRLRSISEGLMQHFIAGLAPSVNRVAQSLMGLATDGFEGAETAGTKFGYLVEKLAVSLLSIETSVELAMRKFGLLSSAVDQFRLGNFSGAAEDLKTAFGVINDQVSESLLRRLEKFKEALKSATTPEKTAKTGLLPDPVDKSNIDGEDAISKQKLKNKVDDAKLAADLQKAINDIELRDLEELYKHELVTVQEYFDRKKQLQAENLQAEMKGLNQEINLEFDHIEALEKKQKAQDQSAAGQKETAKLEVERLATLDRFNQLVEKLQVAQAKLNDLQNKNRDGSNNALKAQADQMERTAAEANRLAQAIANVYAVLQERIARVTVADKNAGVSLTETQTKINALNSEAAASVGAMTQKYKELAEASGDPKLIVNAEKLTTKYDELGKKISWVKDSVISSAQSVFENFFISIGDSSKSAADKFIDFGKSIIASIEQITAKMFALWVVEKLIGFAVGAFGGAGVPGGGAGDVTDFGIGDIGDAVPFFAAGGAMDAGMPGIVGDAGPELWIPDTAGTVVPLSKASAFGQGGGGDSYYYDFRGADPGSEQRIMSAIRNMGLWAKNAAQVEMKERQARSI